MKRASVRMDTNCRRQISGWMLITIVLLSARAAVALNVGTVVAAEGTAEIARDKTRLAAAPNASIRVGDELSTGSPGRVSLGFFDRDVAAAVGAEEANAIVNSLTVAENSLAVVDKYDLDPRGPQARFLLWRGHLSALVARTSAGYEIKTPSAVAVATGTVFVVTYDPSTEVTEVVGLTGRLRVAGLAGQEVWVSAREITEVAKGQPPTPPRPVSDQQFRQYIEGMEFIGGGRPESLTVRSALREGAKVPQPDRFALGVGRPPDALSLCPTMSAPVCATQQPLSGLGGVNIEF